MFLGILLKKCNGSRVDFNKHNFILEVYCLGGFRSDNIFFLSVFSLFLIEVILS